MKNDHTIWLGDEGSFKTYQDILTKVNETSPKDLEAIISTSYGPQDEDEDQDGFGDMGYMVSRHNNVGIVSISGPLVTENNRWNRYFGVVSYEEIRNAVFSAIEHPEVSAVLLLLGTPGGSASGVSGAADFIREVNDSLCPVYAFTDTVMASGGYWLGSSSKEIFAGKLATVGSIGVITTHASYAERLKKDGVEVTVIRKGEYKSLGTPYEKLDGKAREQIEAQMDSIYNVFLETVSDYRGIPIPALIATAAEGRVFIGAEAVPVGLVDSIDTFDRVVEHISSKHKNNVEGLEVNQHINLSEFDMKKKVLTKEAVAAIASGAPEAEVLADPKMITETEEGKEAPKVEAAAEEGKEAAKEVEGKVEEGVTLQAAPDKTLETLLDKVTSLSTELAQSKADLTASQSELTKAKSTEVALTKIVIDVTNRMQLPLGGMVSKMDGMDVSLVISQYNRVHSIFNAKYRAGASAEVPSDADSKGEKSVVNHAVENANRKLTLQ